jgi:hypothetical protein
VRYCSEECRREARRWSRWKAQQTYRETAAGKEKRNEQSRRYRERVRKRSEQAPQETARVITKDFFSITVATGPAAMKDSRVWGESPLRRFCSRECRRAMERVWQRERRWGRVSTGS